MNVADVLELTVSEAAALFANDRDVIRSLQPIVDVGLEYVKLGQPVPTLSGGEAQRLKLAGFLAETVQEATADDLIWGVAYQLADLNRLITLEPGDVVLTGTPANSRPMEPGDTVEVEISGLGRLTNHVVAWDVDLSGPGDQLEVSPNTLHVALAIPEDEAERLATQGSTTT